MVSSGVAGCGRVHEPFPGERLYGTGWDKWPRSVANDCRLLRLAKVCDETHAHEHWAKTTAGLLRWSVAHPRAPRRAVARGICCKVGMPSDAAPRDGNAQETVGKLHFVVAAFPGVMEEESLCPAAVGAAAPSGARCMSKLAMEGAWSMGKEAGCADCWLNDGRGKRAWNCSS